MIKLYIVHMCVLLFSRDLHQVPMLSEAKVLLRQTFASIMSEATSPLHWNMTQKATRLHGR